MRSIAEHSRDSTRRLGCIIQSKMATRDERYNHSYHRVPGLDNVDREDFHAVQKARDDYNWERFASYNGSFCANEWQAGCLCSKQPSVFKEKRN